MRHGQTCTRNLVMTLGLVLLGACGLHAYAEASPYVLNPTGFGDMVVFEHHSRLWLMEPNDSMARPLTRSNQEELSPAISPDGKLVAYVADTGADYEVHVTTVGTGEGERLTFLAADDVIVQGWLSETEILFSATGMAGKRGPSLHAVDVITKATRILPLMEVSEGCRLGGDFVFTRNQPLLDNIQNYRGGYAQQIYRIAGTFIDSPDYIATPAAPSERLSVGHDGISRNPQCVGGRIYFLTDRSGRFNIWSMTADGTDLHQHTFERDHDIRSMSSADGRSIVFGAIGNIYSFDTESGAILQRKIEVPDIAAANSATVALSALDAMEFQVSNDAQTVILVIRGTLWALDRRVKTATCLECDAGQRISGINLTADARSVFALNDVSGEYAIHHYDVAGMVEPVVVPHTIDAPLRDLSVSPNGRDLLVRTIPGKLYHVDADTGLTREVDLESRTQPEDVNWSADGRYAVFVTYTATDIGRITLFDTACQEVNYLTSGRHEVGSPVFDPRGSHIYFLVDLNFRSSVNDTWGPSSYWPSIDRMSLIHALPFAPPQDDNVAHVTQSQPSDGAVECFGRIDWTTDPRHRPLMQEMPYVAGNYSRLAVNGNTLIAFSKRARRDSLGTIEAFPLRFDGPRSAGQPAIAQTIASFALSANATAILTVGPDGMFASALDGSGTFDLPDNIAETFAPTIEIDTRAERAQMFRELWRMYRDDFWDSEFVGVDWDAELATYMPHVARVSNRAEFNDLAGYMVGSLSSGHTSIARPFSEGVPARAVARLGASFGDRNGAVVLEIFDGDLDITDERSPLTQVSPPIEVLDRVTHFNGATVRSVDSLERMLVGKVGERVMLTVEKPDGTQREHWVTAISAADEAWLRGKAWAAGNARAAAAMSDGRVGYIHLASAYADDFGDFMAQYGSLHDREGLILDLRGNNGGNIDPWVLNLLQRRTWLYVKDRHDQFPLEHPRDSFSGRLVVLIDGDTYSDGELIAEGVRQLGLGLLVGTRTTGAGIWVNDDRRLIDGGRVRIPVSSSFLPGDPETRLVIEGHGIAPDTVVENDPYLFFHGHDAQLEHAVALALEDAVGAQ